MKNESTIDDEESVGSVCPRETRIYLSSKYLFRLETNHFASHILVRIYSLSETKGERYE